MVKPLFTTTPLDKATVEEIKPVLPIMVVMASIVSCPSRLSSL